jgi:isoamylase
MSRRRVGAGQPFPLGATPDSTGTNFALFSDNADGVTLCLFSYDGKREIERIDIHECTNGVWHCHLPGIGRGNVYGYRVHGPWAPEEGHRFNANKLLLDPYARQLVGEIEWDDSVYGYQIGADGEADLVMDERDSAPFVPKARVTPPLRLVATRHPRVAWPKSIIYEAHARGLTMLHPMIPEEIRGTFAALSRSEIIDHLTSLGVTALELLPVHAFAQDRHLLEKGLRNYWGYNTLAFFAPEPNYLGQQGVEEIAMAVDRLHQAGIEVILDVVYNHTCEGNHLGPTLSFKGIDNASYYRLLPGQQRYYDDFTGCGNAINTDHPRVLQMVMDSLRLWREIYGIDGFRFDLAVTLGRRPDGFTPDHAFFRAIAQDPSLQGAKLIAEPWDIGPGGYQVGNFPPGFSEWNGDYRDVVRDFWSGSEGMLPAFATRFAASADLYGEGTRRPWSSVNFITAHDGFTLHDLVSYNEKHNEANGEDNQDGHNDNKSWNFGVEGETDDEEILAQRDQQKRNLLATLLLSQGVPMILAGDEFGNSQGGNNNAYCQDNEIGWTDWSRHDPELQAFVRKLIDLRNHHSAISRPEFVTGARNAKGQPDISWFSSTGSRMAPEEWGHPHVKCLTVTLAPVNPEHTSVLIMLNAAHHDVDFIVPKAGSASWNVLLATAGDKEGAQIKAGSTVSLAARSILLAESPQ